MAVRYESTNRKSPEVSFREALMAGQAPDLGLYTPKEVPALAEGDFGRFRGWEYSRIAEAVALPFLEDEMPAREVANITASAYDFDVPLQKVSGRTHIMRLDRGPTASFKDFAARMMARLMQYFLREDGRRLTILTATSGDTGSAVANAFHGMENIRVVVIFPEREVTERQRRQMTTLGGNVTAIALAGKFDECQALVKRAFADRDLTQLNLSSANSINFGRLLPQSVYYVYAYSKLFQSEGEEIVFAVPSGNFGDLMGGMLAKRMGLPIGRFIVATNENDEFPRFLESGEYSPIRPSKACLSNAMNVGHPSNLARLFHMYGGWMDEKGKVKARPDLALMRRDMWSVSVTDDETRRTIKDAYASFKIVLEPHGAVAWNALNRYPPLKIGGFAVSLETADPAKFPDELVSLLGFDPEVPDSLKGLDGPQEMAHLSGDYPQFKGFLKRIS
jgi:threonine synthase